MLRCINRKNNSEQNQKIIDMNSYPHMLLLGSGDIDSEHIISECKCAHNDEKDDNQPSQFEMEIKFWSFRVV